MASKSSQNTILKVARTTLHLLVNVLLYLIIIYIVINAGKVIYDTSYQIFGNTGVTEGEGRDVFVRVEQGESTMNVANKLEQNKVIDNKYSFYIHAKVKKYPIMPGTFALNTSMDYDDIFEVITKPYTEEDAEAEEQAAEETEETEETEVETEGLDDGESTGDEVATNELAYKAS